MNLTPRELATVLAALRHFQNTVLPFRNPTQLTHQFPDHFAEHNPLSHEEIDDLCERINCGEDQ